MPFIFGPKPVGLINLSGMRKTNKRNPVPTEDPAVLCNDEKTLKGEQKREQRSLPHVKRSFRGMQSRTFRAGCPRCAPRNTSSEETVQDAPTGKCWVKGS